jgi:hypothetical protein
VFVPDGYWSPSGSVPCALLSAHQNVAAQPPSLGHARGGRGAPGAGNPVGDAPKREARFGGPLSLCPRCDLALGPVRVEGETPLSRREVLRRDNAAIRGRGAASYRGRPRWATAERWIIPFRNRDR